MTCDAPAPLGQYDNYCEGLRVDYFLLAKQRRAPSLTGLTPNISSFVPNLNGTVSTGHATANLSMVSQDVILELDLSAYIAVCVPSAIRTVTGQKFRVAGGSC